MRPLRHPIKHMLNSGISQVPRHHFPSLRKNVRIMNGHIACRQIQLKVSGKRLDHLHGSFHDLYKRYSRPRSRVVVDGKELIAALLPPNDKSRAVVGAKNPLHQHVVRNPGRHMVYHHADGWTFFRRRSQKTACHPKKRHKPCAAACEGTEIWQMIKLKLSHDLAGKIAIPRRDIRFVSVVMHDSALGVTMLEYQRARLSGTLQSA